MNTFSLNGYSIRYFSHDGDIWFITADANKAFNFSGGTTSLNKVSIQLEDLAINESFIDSSLTKDALVISVADLFKVLGRSTKPELSDIRDQIFSLAAHHLTQQLQPQRLALPSADMQVDNLAGAVAKGRSKEPTDLINLPGWLTVSEMLHELGETIEDQDSLNHDSRFRHWINRHLSDLYRAQHGDEPPTVSRKNGKGYCYPGEFITTAKRYLKQWRQGIMVA